MMNTNFNDILTAVNGQLNDQNISAGGISAISIASQTITNPLIAPHTIINSNLALGSVLNSTIGEQINHGNLAKGPIATSSGAIFLVTGTTETTIANATATVVSTNKPAIIGLMGIPSILNGNVASRILLRDSIVSQPFATIRTYMDGAEVASELIGAGAGGAIVVPCSTINSIWVPASGTHVFTFTAVASASTTLIQINCSAYAVEL